LAIPLKLLLEDLWPKRHHSIAIASEEGRDLNKLADADACELVQKLTAHALRVFAQYGLGGKYAVIPGTGRSAEDFVLDVLTEYLTGKLKTKDLPYLYTALRHKIIDKLRSAPHKTTNQPTANDDEELNSGAPKQHRPAQIVRPDDFVGGQSTEMRVRACVESEPKLRELVEAIFDLGLLTPREIAEALNVPATEVYVRKKQLRRRLITLGIPEVPLER
jgi:DNA-directed RNA polymerase specialized sigma24 family protein